MLTHEDIQRAVRLAYQTSDQSDYHSRPTTSRDPDQHKKYSVPLAIVETSDGDLQIVRRGTPSKLEN